MNPHLHPPEITAQPLERAAYAPYGNVVAADPALPACRANQGTAERYNRLGALENRRPTTATANLCVFRSQPFRGETFAIQLLERHAHSTQLFSPLAGSERYLVIVCGGGESPDLRTLRAFIASTGQGITYHPGVWHHPLIALDRATDFACVVYEDDTAADCDVRPISPAITVKF